MTDRSALIPGLRWTTLSTVLSFVLSFVQTAILARLLSKTDFAWVAIAAVFVNIGLHLQSAGINAAIIQRPHNSHEQLSALYWLNLLIGITLLSLGAGIAWGISEFYQSSTLWQIFMWYNLTFVANAFGVQYKALLQKEFRFRALAIIEVIANMAGFTVAVLGAWQGWGALALVAGYLTKYFTESLGALIIGLQSFIPTLQFKMHEIRSYGQFGAIFTAERLVTHFVSQLDVLLISRWLGMDATGVYDVFKRVLARPSVLLNISIEKVAFPVLSELQRDNQKIARTYYKLLNISTVIHLPMYALATVLAPWLVSWYFGAAWTPHIATFQALCGFVIVFAWMNPVESLLLAKGKIQWQLFLYLLMAPFLAGAIWIGSRYGLIWSTAAIVLVQFAFTILAYIIFLKNLLPGSQKRLIKAVGQPVLLTFVSFILASPLFLFQMEIIGGILFLVVYSLLTIRYNTEFMTFTKAILKR